MKTGQTFDTVLECWVDDIVKQCFKGNNWHQLLPPTGKGDVEMATVPKRINETEEDSKDSKIGKIFDIGNNTELVIYELHTGKAHEFLKVYKNKVIPILKEKGVKDVYGWVIKSGLREFVVYSQSYANQITDLPWEQIPVAAEFFKKLEHGTIIDLPAVDKHE